MASDDSYPMTAGPIHFVNREHEEQHTRLGDLFYKKHLLLSELFHLEKEEKKLKASLAVFEEEVARRTKTDCNEEESGETFMGNCGECGECGESDEDVSEMSGRAEHGEDKSINSKKDIDIYIDSFEEPRGRSALFDDPIPDNVCPMEEIFWNGQGTNLIYEAECRKQKFDMKVKDVETREESEKLRHRVEMSYLQHIREEAMQELEGDREKVNIILTGQPIQKRSLDLHDEVDDAGTGKKKKKGERVGSEETEQMKKALEVVSQLVQQARDTFLMNNTTLKAKLGCESASTVSQLYKGSTKSCLLQSLQNYCRWAADFAKENGLDSLIDITPLDYWI